MANSSSKSSPQTIVVIGAGVIGLSCALKLQNLVSQRQDLPNNTQVLIVAREWPASFPGGPPTHSADYASMWAGAHVRPIPPSTPQLQREAGWLKQTCVEFEQLVRTEPWAGVTQTGGVEYLEVPSEEYRKQTKESFEAECGLSGYRRLEKGEMPAEVVLGIEYDTYSVNPPVYCSSLLRRFLLKGGKTMRRDLRSPKEAFSLVPNISFVVNASGVGFGDPKSFPTRGQTVATDIKGVTKTVTRQNKDGTWRFLIPRGYNGGTIVGGTKEPGNWDINPSMASRESIIKGGRELVPYAHDGPTTSYTEPIGVIADIVGRRPTREGGMRIEVEEVKLGAGGQGSGTGSQTGRVLHAYGAGGRGYELSLGIAGEVAELARSLLDDGPRPRSKL